MYNFGGFLCFLLVMPQMCDSTPDKTEKELGCVGSVCYTLSSSKLSTSEAQANCQSIGGILAVVNDQKILDYLANAIKSDDGLWIGLSILNSNSGWVFSDGTPLEGLAFIPPWKATSSHRKYGYSQGRENCALLYKKQFSKEDCSAALKYICQVTQLPCNIGGLSLPNSVFENCLTNILVNGSDQIAVECASGYAAKGHSDWLPTKEVLTTFNVTCFNGTWEDYPHCTPICSILPDDSNRISVLPKRPFYFMGDNITLICQDGYFTNQEHPMSHMTLTCLGVNQWEPSTHSLDCIPASKFIFAHKQYEELLMEVELGQTFLLECTGKDKALHSHQIDYVWFRDQHEIRTLEVLNYTVSSNGNLLVHSFNVTDEGLYSCYFDDVPGSVTYKIKVSNNCHNITPTYNVIFDENSSPKLPCPEYDSLINVIPPTWYKDGMRLLGNEKFIILPNGALFIPNITLLDNGMYTCEVTQEGGFCPKRYSTQVSVTSVGNTCGRIGNAAISPWLVSLWWEEEKVPFCYGARIDEQWIITSASCLFGVHRKKRPDFFIHIGNTSGILGNTSYLLPVESTKIYPFYSRRNNYGDIGLIKLRSALQFWKKDHIKPLCLPETDIGLQKTEHGACELPKALTGIVSGWGSLEESFEKASLKREALTVAAVGECQLPTCGSVMADSMFCASGTESQQKQAGDSGSPFDLEWMGQLYLYGIFSYGERASMVGKYDYYTKVSCYSQWITSHMKNN